MQKVAVSITFDDDVREKSLKDLIDELKELTVFRILKIY
jgi:hypothetical protein